MFLFSTSVDIIKIFLYLYKNRAKFIKLTDVFFASLFTYELKWLHNRYWVSSIEKKNSGKTKKIWTERAE